MYRMYDIEDWLEDMGVEEKIFRARTPDTPVRCVTLIARGGTGLSAEGAETIAGLEVRSRDQNYDKAEALAFKIDEILVPYDPFNDYNGIYIGASAEHKTRIVGTSRRGSEPGVISFDQRQVTFSALYFIRAIRRSRTAAEWGISE